MTDSVKRFLLVFFFASICVFSSRPGETNSWCDDLGGGPALLGKADIEPTIPRLLEATFDATLSLAVRQSSLQMLCVKARPGDARLLEALTKLVDDRDGTIRKSALLLLGLKGTEAQYPVLAGALQKGDQSEQVVAIDALERLKCDRCTRAIGTALVNEKATSTTRIHAANALGRLGGREAPRFLGEAAEASDARLSTYASIALLRIGNREVLPILMKNLTTAPLDESIRNEAVRAVERAMGESFRSDPVRQDAIRERQDFEAFRRMLLWWQEKSAENKDERRSK